MFLRHRFVLLKMHSAKLIWITPHTEKLIAEIARVSNPDAQCNPKYMHLLKYLIKHNHWSPFEMASMCVEINTTRAIAPQILRHRSFSFQEFSQRYAEPDLGTILKAASNLEMRFQDYENRQNSLDNVPLNIANLCAEEIERVSIENVKLYERLINLGVAKECARSVLPLLTPTKLYMSGTIRSWIHYAGLRGGNGTQREHCRIADDISKIIESELPSVALAVSSKTCI